MKVIPKLRKLLRLIETSEIDIHLGGVIVIEDPSRYDLIKLLKTSDSDYKCGRMLVGRKPNTSSYLWDGYKLIHSDVALRLKQLGLIKSKYDYDYVNIGLAEDEDKPIRAIRVGIREWVNTWALRDIPINQYKKLNYLFTGLTVLKWTEFV